MTRDKRAQNGWRFFPSRRELHLHVPARMPQGNGLSKWNGAGILEEPRGLVFFYASDGTNGGMPFAVYDSRTGMKIFQDSAFDSTWLHNKVEVSLFNRPRVSSTPDGQVSLKYLRVVEADCDLYREKSSCWEQVRKKLEVKSTEVPVCSGYKNVTTRWVSAVAYPVGSFPFYATNHENYRWPSNVLATRLMKFCDVGRCRIKSSIALLELAVTDVLKRATGMPKHQNASPKCRAPFTGNIVYL